ncbi:MAG: ABC-F family ATP-binding cassette domain-containing protein [Verrucomicrobia bacterium]|nr:ABC-F family ATP-binding cassette domain-containing protein [Cytophagales bacterium]
MNFISAENISKNFNEKWLFKNVSTGVSQGEKVALVGQNGSGKTTLLNILAGVIVPDDGSVSVRKGISVGYLDQNPVLDEKLTVIEAVFAGKTAVLAAIRNYEKYLTEPESEAFASALEQMEALNAWDYESNIKQILGKLGMDDFEKKISSLSGGQRKRVALAKLLIDEPDLLILDEPTNHLDLDTIEWLENLLATDNRTLLMVSHDRYFLDKVCNEIISLENGKLYRYKGNYAYFLEKKAEREMAEASELEKSKNTFRRELEWMRRQPKARGTKAQYRVDAFEELKDKVSQKKNDSSLELAVKMNRLGGKILEIEKINKSFGNQSVVKDFSYIFKKKDRLGIVGKNGVGKSSFLNLLTGNLLPDSGSISAGETVIFGYYTQSELVYKAGQKVIDVVKEIAEVITLGNGETISVSQFLTHFLFPPAVQYTPVEKLSGGEKRRLQLLKVLVKNPNFLILDEPTNDLDISTLNVLEEFLLNFGGCLLLVSHDRYFMDSLVENLFIFEGEGKIRNFNGNYSDYRNWLEEEAEEKKNKVEKVKNSDSKLTENQNVISKKLSFKELREYENLEQEIEDLEKQKVNLVDLLNAGSENHEQLTNWGKELQTLEKTIVEKSDRWLKLSELV